MREMKKIKLFLWEFELPHKHLAENGRALRFQNRGIRINLAELNDISLENR